MALPSNFMIQEIPYAGWKRNLRIQGPTTELVVTLEVGPRILRYAFHDGSNVFVEMADQLGGSGEAEWMLRGGHRFWTAPEADHSYERDNGPVEWKQVGDLAVEITEPVSKTYGFQKTMRIELLENELVRVTHLLTNTTSAAIDVTPWVLSVMAPGGTAIIPQPPFNPHPSEFPEGRSTCTEDYLPNRELVLWPFTNLSDGRFDFGIDFLRVRFLPEMPATKIGLKLATGWLAYQNGETVFAKHFVYDPAQPYPDRGSNFELFTNYAILELESLAPALPLEAGAVREHVEHWVLRPTTADLRGEKAAKAFFADLPKI